MGHKNLSLVKLAVKSYRREIDANLILLPNDADGAFEALLHVAAGDGAWMKLATSTINTQPSELKKAALLLVTQLSFEKSKDAYSVLGLNALATEASIKHHYRLMMRLFHPDKVKFADKKAKAYASEINRAMESIRNASLKPIQQVRPSSSLNPSFNIRFDSSTYAYPDSPFFKKLRESIVNYGLIVFMIWVGVMLIAMYMWRQAHPIMKPEESRFYGKASITPQDDRHDYELSQADEPSKTPHIETEITPSQPQDLLIEKKLAASINEEQQIKKEAVVKKPKAPKAVPIAETTPKTGELILPDDHTSQKIAAAEVFPEIKNEFLNESKISRVEEKVLSQKEMRNLVYDFVDDFNHGKLDALMQLISDKLHITDNMTKASWRLYYEKLFLETTKREMLLRNLQLDPIPKGMKAKTHYESKLFYANQSAPQIIMGVIEMEAHYENEAPKITLFIHRTISPSSK